MDSSSETWNVALQWEEALEGRNGALQLERHTSASQRSCSGRPTLSCQMSGCGRGEGNSQDTEPPDQAGQDAARLVTGPIVNTSPPSPGRAPLQHRVHRTAAASSGTWSEAASEDRTARLSSGPHWPAIFSAAAAYLRSGRALHHRQALHSAAWYAVSCVHCMSLSLPSKPKQCTCQVCVA